jgi:hypothetical protein
MAINGDTVYAAMNSGKMYKSTDAGATWVELKGSPGPGPPFPAGVDKIAVAPDDADQLVAADLATNTVWYSGNGGAMWDDMKLAGATGFDPAAIVYDVDISEGPVRSIAAVGENLTDGELYLFTMMGMFPGWAKRANGAGFNIADSINAVKFSPNYATDKIILTVTDPVGTAGDALFQVYWD